MTIAQKDVRRRTKTEWVVGGIAIVLALFLLGLVTIGIVTSVVQSQQRQDAVDNCANMAVSYADDSWWFPTTPTGIDWPIAEAARDAHVVYWENMLTDGSESYARSKAHTAALMKCGDHY